MKKIFLLFFLIMGIFPCLKEGRLTMDTVMKANAQNYGEEGTLNNLGDWGDHGVGDEFDFLPENGSPIQVPNFCEFESLSIVSNYMAGYISQGEIATFYANEYHENPLDGVQESDADDLIEEFCDTNTLSDFSDIQDAIDDNHLVLAAIDEGNGESHQVVITGWNDDGTVQYFDPATGGYENSALTQFYDLKEVTSFHNPIPPN